MANLWQPSIQRALDNNGNPISGALMSLFLTGTTTPAPYYRDAAGTVLATNPQVSDAAGVFSPIYLDPDTTYRIRLTDANGVAIRADVDPVRGFDETQLSGLAQQVEDDKDAAQAAAAEAADALTEIAQLQALAATLASDQPFPNAYATTLPKGVTSGTIGGDPVTGATPGTYALTPVGGSITGVLANLVVTNATTASIVIVNTGLGTGTTPPTWANPVGATLPAGTTLTAVVSSIIPTQKSYAVASSGSTSVLIYKNDGTSTPAAVNNPNGSQIELPQINAIPQLIAAIYPHFITPPPLGSPLLRVGKPYIYPEVNGVAITLPSQLTVREIGRDSVSGGRFRLYLSQYTAPSTYALRIGVAASGSHINPTGYTGWRDIPLTTVDNTSFPGIANGTQIGVVPIYFGDGSNFGALGVNYTYAQGGLYDDQLGESTTFAAQVNSLIASALSTEALLDHGVFAPTVRDARLRAMFAEGMVVNLTGRPAYISSILKGSVACTIKVNDVATGALVGFYKKVDGGGIDYNTMPERISAFGRTQPVMETEGGDYTGWDINFRVADWTTFATTETPYTFNATTGALADACHYSKEAVDKLFVDGIIGESVTVGSGQTYATIQDALDNDIYDEGARTNPFTNTQSQTCARACPTYIVSIDLYGDDTDFELTNGEFPDWVWLRFMGRSQRIIPNPAAGANPLPCVQGHRNFRYLNTGTLYTNATSNYASHHDNIGSLSIPCAEPLLPAVQNWFNRTSGPGIEFVGGPTKDGRTLGLGIDGGGYMDFRGAGIVSLNPANTGGQVVLHNTAGQANPGLADFRGVRFPNAFSTSSIQLQSLGAGGKSMLLVDGMDANILYDGSATLLASVAIDSIIDLQEWDIVGTPQGAVGYGDYRAIVLQVPVGTTINETGTPVLFGDIDEWGLGDRWVFSAMDGGLQTAPKSLGKRLGVNPTYSVSDGTNTWVASNVTNYTNVPNATIIAAMVSAGLTVSEALWDTYHPTRTGGIVNLKNGGGAAMGKGIAVKLTDSGQMAIADGEDDVFGITLTPCAINATAYVETKRRVMTTYLSGSPTTNGKFRIANGVPTFTGIGASTPAKGYVRGASPGAVGVAVFY